MTFKPDDAETLKKVVASCADHMDRLTNWEQNFIEKMNDLLHIGTKLTDGQKEKLEEIYQKVP